MSQEIKVSKVGVNVGTATNPNDLTYTSVYNTLKYYTSGSLTIVGTVDPNLTATFFGTATHNLGYYPFVSAYVKNSSDSQYFPYGRASLGAGLSIYIGLVIGTSNIRFIYRLISGGGSENGTATCVYKIFRNNLGF